MLALLRTKVALLSIIGLAVVGASVGAGTFAFFSAQATSASNTFAAGTLTLALTDDNETALQSVSATWTSANFAPGDLVSGFLLLQNTGSVAASHVDISVTNLVTEALTAPGTTATTPMDTVLVITFLCYNSNGDSDCTDPGEVDLLAILTDVNGNGVIDLDDLENTDAEGAEDLVDLALTDLAIDHRLDMSIQFSPSLGVNQHQGDNVVTTVDVVLNQDASQ